MFYVVIVVVSRKVFSSLGFWPDRWVEWGKGVVSQHRTRLRRRQRLAEAQASRSAQKAATFLAEGGDGKPGGVRRGGPRGDPPAEQPAPDQAQTLKRLRALRKSAMRAVADQAQVQGRSAEAWAAALAAGKPPGVSAALWGRAAAAFRRAGRLGRCQASPLRVKRARKAPKKVKKAKAASKAMK